ncbi:MAG: type IX secretion system outer membrane channel protein PorV, partial [Cyclobacteriaceae bacterium]|nr:type IX secretion system outer membrane channel protein PorV [Cyclobacteriaceae bacterium]
IKAQGFVGQDSTNRVITSAVPFLSITPDARSGGMGDTGGAISPDVNSIYWNPAKLAFIETQSGMGISYTPWLGKLVNDMFITYLSGYYKITREQAVGISMRYFDLGEFFMRDEIGNPQGEFNPREFAFDGTYSRMLSENLGVGVVLRYVHSNLTGSFTSGTVDARPGSSAAADFSVYYTKDIINSGKNSNISLGGTISNIGGKLTYSDEANKDFLPANLRLASAYTTNFDPFNKITFALDLNKLLVPSPPIYDINGVLVAGKDPDRSMLSGVFGSFTDAPNGFREEMQEFMLAMGAEYWYNDSFAARAGYFTEHRTKGNRKYITMGLGFRYQMFGIDFAYLVPREQEHPLAETMRFSLIFNFEEKAEEESVTN